MIDIGAWTDLGVPKDQDGPEEILGRYRHPWRTIELSKHRWKGITHWRCAMAFPAGLSDPLTGKKAMVFLAGEGATAEEAYGEMVNTLLEEIWDLTELSKALQKEKT